MRRLEEEAGLVFPPELRAWWGWHNGVVRLQPGTRLGIESRIGAGAWEFLSAEEALESRARQLSINVRQDYPASDEEWQFQWRDSWLPVVTFDADSLFVDCAGVMPPGTVTVRGWDHTPDDVFTPRACSFSSAVAIWVDLLESRYFWWSSEQQGWDDRWQEVPECLRMGGVI